MVSTIRHRKPSLEEEIKDVELRTELEGEQENTSKSISEQQHSGMCSQVSYCFQRKKMEENLDYEIGLGFTYKACCSTLTEY